MGTASVRSHHSQAIATPPGPRVNQVVLPTADTVTTFQLFIPKKITHLYNYGANGLEALHHTWQWSLVVLERAGLGITVGVGYHFYIV